MLKRLRYWQRIIKAYLLPSTSQLTFWHGKPEVNPSFTAGQPSPYYMKFHYKADYEGHFDDNGIPMLDYHGAIGLQYNPIAVSQYGLGNYNLYKETGDNTRLDKFLSVADWHVENLEPNKYGIPVWHHYFDFDYRDTLKSPWYSGLAQGLGFSVLLRAYKETGDNKYLDCHKSAYLSMVTSVDKGGVIFTDSDNNPWLEEYIVDPPTHILNGFLWGLWGIYDAWIYLEDESAKELFFRLSATVEKNLHLYDTGYWSLYEQSGLRLPMLASPFYHDLHIVQLGIMHELTGKPVYETYHKRWIAYRDNTFSRKRAYFMKVLFKIFNY